jgi:hypothetical protein
VPAGDGQHLLEALASFCTRLGRAGAQNRGAFQATARALLKHIGNHAHRRGDYSKIDWFIDIKQRAHAGAAEQFAVAGVDQIQLAAETGAHQVVENHVPQGARTLGCVHQGDALRCEQVLQVV